MSIKVLEVDNNALRAEIDYLNTGKTRINYVPLSLKQDPIKTVLLNESHTHGKFVLPGIWRTQDHGRSRHGVPGCENRKTVNGVTLAGSGAVKGVKMAWEAIPVDKEKFPHKLFLV